MVLSLIGKIVAMKCMIRSYKVCRKIYSASRDIISLLHKMTTSDCAKNTMVSKAGEYYKLQPKFPCLTCSFTCIVEERRDGLHWTE